MQQRAGAVRVIGYGMLLSVCGLGAPIGLAYAQGSSTRADVAEMRKHYDEALNQHWSKVFRVRGKHHGESHGRARSHGRLGHHRSVGGVEEAPMRGESLRNGERHSAMR